MQKDRITTQNSGVVINFFDATAYMKTDSIKGMLELLVIITAGV